MQLTVRLVLKEWQFSDGSHSFNNFHIGSQPSLNGSSNFLSRTGRKINITVVEGKDLVLRDKNGKFDPYVKLQYGKVGFFFMIITYDTKVNDITTLCVTHSRCIITVSHLNSNYFVNFSSDPPKNSDFTGS